MGERSPQSLLVRAREQAMREAREPRQAETGTPPDAR